MDEPRDPMPAEDPASPEVSPPAAAQDEPTEAPPARPEAEVAEVAPEPAPPAPKRSFLEERDETPIEVPRKQLVSRSRRQFLLFGAGVVASAVAGGWLLPDRARRRLLPGLPHDRLDTLAARTGLSKRNREAFLDRALAFDDDVAEALYSKGRRVRTYGRHQVTPLRNNYAGRTPAPETLAGWRLAVSGLASGATERLALDDLLARHALHGQITRLVCVEGWSAIAWWGGIRFADFLAAFPPAPGARWAAMRSELNLDGRGRPEPYYVSIDLETARHPQTLLATHFAGRPLPMAHGAPLRLVVPMKLGLKNIKAITHIAYVADEPPDYWNQRGYSKYDGL